MKNKLLIFGFSLLLLSCENDLGKLKGHWHIYEYNQHGNFDTNEYHTIDIEGAGLAFFDKNSFYPSFFLGAVNTIDKTILMGGECAVLDLEYEWKNDSLFFTQIQYSDSFYAEKCEVACCDKQKDFFSEISLEIDLPIIKDTTEAIASEELHPSLELPIIIGIPKMDCYISPMLKLGDKFSVPEDIEMWHEIVKQTVPIDYRDKLYFTLFANKTIGFKELYELINEIKKLDIDFIYLALREENTKEKFKVWRKKVSLDDLGLKTIIENHYADF